MPRRTARSVSFAIALTASLLASALPAALGAAEATPAVVLASRGEAVALLPRDADLTGVGLKPETVHGVDNLGFWGSAKDRAAWNLAVPAAATYAVTAEIASPEGEVPLALAAGAAHSTGTATTTADWQTYRSVDLGRIALPAGPVRLTLGSQEGQPWHPLNLRRVTLTPAP